MKNYQGRTFTNIDEFITKGISLHITPPNDAESVCPICSQSWDHDIADPVVGTRNCTRPHYFHMTCILIWLRQEGKKGCPNCRHEFYRVTPAPRRRPQGTSTTEPQSSGSTEPQYRDPPQISLREAEIRSSLNVARGILPLNATPRQLSLNTTRRRISIGQPSSSTGTQLSLNATPRQLSLNTTPRQLSLNTTTRRRTSIGQPSSSTGPRLNRSIAPQSTSSTEPQSNLERQHRLNSANEVLRSARRQPSSSIASLSSERVRLAQLASDVAQVSALAAEAEMATTREEVDSLHRRLDQVFRGRGRRDDGA